MRKRLGSCDGCACRAETARGIRWLHSRLFHTEKACEMDMDVGRKKDGMLFRSIPCPRLRWLMEHRESAVCAEETVERHDTEEQVFVSAARYLGGGFEEPEGETQPDRLAGTRKLLEQKKNRIGDALFAFDDIVCRADFLIGRPDGTFDVWLVCAGVHIRRAQLLHAALVLEIMRENGVSVNEMRLLPLAPAYTPDGTAPLFCPKEISGNPTVRGCGMHDRLMSYRKHRYAEAEPELPLREKCLLPEPCPALSHCAGCLSEQNVFRLAGMTPREKLRLYQKGAVSFRQILESGEADAMGEDQRLQIDAAICGRPHIDRAAIRDFLGELTFPLCFLDFESYQPAVPLFPGTRPYESIPFQYSLHILPAPGQAPIHCAFLADSSADPRRALTEQLISDVPDNACLVAYGMDFEKSVLARLAELFPEHRNRLLAMRLRFHDMMRLFGRRVYYTAAMCGSASLKHVLPALFPDDPDLRYERPGAIKNGSEAMQTFAMLRGLSGEVRERLKQQLLAYCALDTYGMVKIWEKLRSECAENAGTVE